MDRERLFKALADEEHSMLLDLLGKAYDEMMRINDIRVTSATASSANT